MNLGQLKSQLQILVSEFPYENYVNEVTQWFNQAQEEIAERNLIEDKMTALSNPDITTYTLPTNFIELKRDGVFVGGKQIDPGTLSDLIDRYGRTWKSQDSGNPQVYLREGWLIRFIPNFADLNKEIILHYYGYPNALENDTDIPFTTGSEATGFDYHNHLRSLDKLILEYGVALAKYSLGMYGNTDSALSLFYGKLDARERRLNMREDLRKQQVPTDPYMLKKRVQRLRRS